MCCVVRAVYYYLSSLNGLILKLKIISWPTSSNFELTKVKHLPFDAQRNLWNDHIVYIIYLKLFFNCRCNKRILLFCRVADHLVNNCRVALAVSQS